MIQLIVLLSSLGLGSIALASGGGEHASIPTIVIYQFINFALFAILLFFLLRKHVSKFFLSREAEFTEAIQRAKSAVTEAENKKKEIMARIAKLKSSSQETIEKAKLEAEKMRKGIIEDAEESAKKLLQEAQYAAKYEVEKAKAELRNDILMEAINQAEGALSKRLSDNDQKRLQEEFVNNIGNKNQVVR